MTFKHVKYSKVVQCSQVKVTAPIYLILELNSQINNKALKTKVSLVNVSITCFSSYIFDLKPQFKA